MNQIETLASLCPHTNGEVVYKARALYDIVNDTLRIFEPGCDSIDDAPSSIITIDGNNAPPPSIASLNDVDEQKYVLYPNPNDGNFTLQQAVLDYEPVEIEIWDAVGRSMYKDRVRFAAGISKLHGINMASGIYLLQVADSKGRMFKFKFTVE